MNISFLLRTLVCFSAGMVAASAATAETSTTVIDKPGLGTNRIEVTGNTARNISVQCAEGPDAGARRGNAANVNSVNVDGRALRGQTVVVTGRNSRDVNVDADCSEDRRGTANVNSVNIR